MRCANKEENVGEVRGERDERRVENVERSVESSGVERDRSESTVQRTERRMEG